MSTEPYPYQDPSLPVADRVKDLVSRMTLEEKVSQMVYDAPAIERLGVPGYNWWNECLHGVGRAGVATVFPAGHRPGRHLERRPDGPHRDGHLGRGAGQAPRGPAARHPRHLCRADLLVAQRQHLPRPALGARPGDLWRGPLPHRPAWAWPLSRACRATIDKYLKLVATPKHYAVHSGPEPERHTFDAVVSERDLRVTYLPAFEACVKEGGAVSVMGAYNRTNGEPCCASPTLLQKILREEWGFGGPTGADAYVVSDCWAIIDIYAHHKLVETPAEAAALAVQAGCDLNCGTTYPGAASRRSSRA